MCWMTNLAILRPNWPVKGSPQNIWETMTRTWHGRLSEFCWKCQVKSTLMKICTMLFIGLLWQFDMQSLQTSTALFYKWHNTILPLYLICFIFAWPSLRRTALKFYQCLSDAFGDAFKQRIQNFTMTSRDLVDAERTRVVLLGSVESQTVFHVLLRLKGEG